ncbi:hypothetical protein FACS1894106_1290 [Spirochaetia bacterium]|nr:hypothetical protein FACS1894106_1290 [Spirochaetia bacterium]
MTAIILSFDCQVNTIPIHYTLRRSSGLAYEKMQSAFVRFFSGTFLRLLETCGFLYRNRKNVV